MSLIVYPLDNYNSFCSLADAENIIRFEIPYKQRKDNWDAIADIANDLTADEQKEVLLRQATILIQQRVQSLPDTLEDNLKRACAYTANDSATKDMANEDGSGNIKRKKIDGAVETEFFAPKEDKSNDFSDIVEGFLKAYDINTSSSAYSFKIG